MGPLCILVHCPEFADRSSCHQRVIVGRDYNAESDQSTTPDVREAERLQHYITGCCRRSKQDVTFAGVSITCRSEEKSQRLIVKGLSSAVPPLFLVHGTLLCKPRFLIQTHVRLVPVKALLVSSDVVGFRVAPCEGPPTKLSCHSARCDPESDTTSFHPAQAITQSS